MSQTNSKTIRCRGFTQRLVFPGTSCIHSLSFYPCLANENLILPSTGIHFLRWMKFQCQAQVALLISYRNKWRRGRCVGSYVEGDTTALDASGISLFNCCCNALRSLPCPCRVIWGRLGGMPPHARSELKEVGIRRPKRDKLLWTSMLLDYLFMVYVLVLIHTGLSLIVKNSPSALILL